MRHHWPVTRSADPPHGPAGMRWIPEGEFLMGSEDFYPEERPVHRVSVEGFWMDEHPVTAAEFRRFVRATGYVTVAERPLDAADYPDADPELLVPGSLVFHGTAGPVDLDDVRSWWAYVPGAYWTDIYSINTQGDIVGAFEDETGVHGFRGTPAGRLEPDAAE